jgi:hypothetical protein
MDVISSHRLGALRMIPQSRAKVKYKFEQMFYGYEEGSSVRCALSLG